MGTRSRRYVIVGDGAAGITAARQLRTSDTQASITLISDDPNPAYFRAALTNYLLGELREEQIWATTPNFYDQYRLHRIHGRVRDLDPGRAAVHLSQGGVPLTYDALLIAAGARARILRFDGNHLRGLMTLRTLQDCRSVMESIASSQLKHAVVVGGGPLALEWALGMHVRGIAVTVLLRGTTLMAGAIDAVASDLLLARLKQAGIQLIVKDEIVAAIDRGDGHVGRVQTRTGLTLDCQLVAVAVGVIPNTEWLVNTGITMSQAGALVVNEHMQTSLSNVFAAGDVAVFDNRPLQLWEPAQSQARIAAANMAGHASRYAPGVHYMATRLFDLDAASLGQVEQTAATEVVLDYPQGTGRIKYRKLLIRDGKLVGVLLLGHREDRVRQGGRLFKRLIDSQVDITRVKTELLSPSFDLRAWLDEQGLVRKESAAAQPVVAKASQIRGTSVLDVSKMGVLPGPAPQGNSAPADKKGGFAAVGAGVTDLPGMTPNQDVQAATLALGTQVLTQFNARQDGVGAGASTLAQPAPTPERPATLEGAGQRWELKAPLYRIGRAADGDVVLQDPSVEQVHANIQRFDGEWYLRDLGSRGGTWVNNEQLSLPQRLSSLARIRVGQTELVFYFSDSVNELAQAPKAQASGPARPRLLVQSGHSLGLSFALAHSPTILGRDPSCAVWLDDAALAPQHASLQQVQGAWHAASLGPGFWHNQRAISSGASVPLKEGDVLYFGSVSVMFTETPVAATESTEHTGLAAPAASAARTSPGQRAGQMQAFEAAAAPAPQSASFGQLRIHAGPYAGHVVPLQELFIVGTAAGCHLCLPAEGVAPQHLELRWVQGRLWARDLSGAARTVKSGAPLGGAAVLVAASDWFTLGPNVSVVYEASQ